jgi:hypothetical protein
MRYLIAVLLWCGTAEAAVINYELQPLSPTAQYHLAIGTYDPGFTTNPLLGFWLLDSGTATLDTDTGAFSMVGNFENIPAMSNDEKVWLVSDVTLEFQSTLAFPVADYILNNGITHEFFDWTATFTSGEVWEGTFVSLLSFFSPQNPDPLRSILYDFGFASKFQTFDTEAYGGFKLVDTAAPEPTTLLLLSAFAFPASFLFHKRS